jgi:hypothetical protein
VRQPAIQWQHEKEHHDKPGGRIEHRMQFLKWNIRPGSRIKHANQDKGSYREE